MPNKVIESENRGRTVSRKKPKDADLALAVTPLGPHTKSRQETVTIHTRKRWKPGKNKPWMETNDEANPIGTTITVPKLDSDLLETTRKAALNKSLEKLKDQRINLAVSLAELPETLVFLYNGGKTLIDMYKTTRKKVLKLQKEYRRHKRLAGGKKHSHQRQKSRSWLKRMGSEADRISSLWLGWRYGVMPLVYDAQGAIAELSRPKEEKNMLFRVKTSQNRTLERKEYSTYHKVGDSGVNYVYKHNYTVSVVYNVRVDTPRSLTQLGFTNGLVVLWEVTPLSFVADWWLNLGETLAGLDAGRGTSFVSGTVSTKVHVSCERQEVEEHRTKSSTATNETFVSATGGMSEYQRYERRVLTELPSPQFYTELSMNTKRYLDAFALLKVILFKTK